MEKKKEINQKKKDKKQKKKLQCSTSRSPAIIERPKQKEWTIETVRPIPTETVPHSLGNLKISEVVLYRHLLFLW